MVIPLTEKEDMRAYAVREAREEGVSSSVVLAVIQCESQWHVFALGDHGHSRGLVQIHNLYHPEVSDEEAYDPKFAIHFLIGALKKGQGNQWTCYRLLQN